MRRKALGDVLAQIFERGSWLIGSTDTRSLTELCDALLSAEGEVSGYRLAATLLNRYGHSDDPEKLAFFQYLNTALELDAEALSALAASYSKDPTTTTFKALSRAAEPRRQELLRRLNQPQGATQSLVAMRRDLLRFQKSAPELARTDYDFAHLLRSWFNRGFLVLQQITWDTPARILDKVVAYEAVHRIDDLDDLRRRLEPADRRCFAFFHPAMPDEPLIFVEVALGTEIPSSIDMLLEDNRTPINPEDATVAIFYSISNCQKGLAGISFGNLLIKQVVAELTADTPNVKTFVTLSPIPNLASWVNAKRQTLPSSEADLRALAAQYLLLAKRDDGLPVDPVARFHLGNGAEIHDIHTTADSSERARLQSGGTMVNYLYNLSKTESHHETFATAGTVAASKTVQALAATNATTLSEETIP
ncbi:MAG: malonyl-CoA decarboxylase family protein [Pseudomonadota bacterium]